MQSLKDRLEGKGSTIDSRMTHILRHTDQYRAKRLAYEQVSAGAAHSLFTGKEGPLWGCGSNAERQLALDGADEDGGAPVPRRLLQSAGRAVRFAVAAGHHSLAVLDEQPRCNQQLRRSMSECRLPQCWDTKRRFIGYPWTAKGWPSEFPCIRYANACLSR